MTPSSATLAAAPTRPARLASDPPLPRADEVHAGAPARRRRDRWGAGRRWPFGPLATALSVGVHAVGLVAIVWALAAPPEPEGIGAQVYAMLTPDLGEPQECPPLEVPEELPEIEALELPTLPDEPDLEPEPTLEPLEEWESPPTASALSLSIVSKRLAPPKAAEPPPPPTPVAVPSPRVAPPPRPRAQPVVAARPPGAMPRGRLRPLVKPIAYPDAARRAGIQGRARVAMTIDPQGAVVDATILASSGFAILDQAALASARQWRFAPPGTFRRAAQTFRFSLN
jgi:protein TonB